MSAILTSVGVGVAFAIPMSVFRYFIGRKKQGSKAALHGAEKDGVLDTIGNVAQDIATSAL